MKSIKIIILFLLFFVTSCYKEDILPQPEPVTDIFKVTESSVMNGQELNYNLDSSGTYILKLVDVSNNQVLSKEKITGLQGKNKLNIYTKSLMVEYLYLVLEDNNKKEIKRTKLTLK